MKTFHHLSTRRHPAAFKVPENRRIYYDLERLFSPPTGFYLVRPMWVFISFYTCFLSVWWATHKMIKLIMCVTWKNQKQISQLRLICLAEFHFVSFLKTKWWKMGCKPLHSRLIRPAYAYLVATPTPLNSLPVWGISSKSHLLIRSRSNEINCIVIGKPAHIKGTRGEGVGRESIHGN